MALKQAHSIAGLALLAVAVLGAVARQHAAREIPHAIGPYINLKPDAFAQARSFRGDDKLVMTHDFYWYDITTKAHIIDGDGSDALTTHPATMEDLSYKSVTWHKKQLMDMMEAGVDVVLPVY
jgi:hypothetical protein